MTGHDRLWTLSHRRCGSANRRLEWVLFEVPERGGRIPCSRRWVRLFQFCDLYVVRTQHGADLGAVCLALIAGIHRTFDLGEDLLELAAQLIEGRPILVLANG